MNNIHGVKGILLSEGRIVLLLRDNKPNIPFPGMWDFPGGGVEVDESPFEALQREVKEECCIDISKNTILWQKKYPALHSVGMYSLFFVVILSESQAEETSLGDEGQELLLMDINKFLTEDKAIPHLKERLKEYLSEA